MSAGRSAGAPIRTALALLLLMLVTSCATSGTVMKPLVIDYDAPVAPPLQSRLEKIDGNLRASLSMDFEPAVGLVDLRTGELAMLHPDRIDYAASIPKVGILYAWFRLHPESARDLDATTRQELGLMIKSSSNEMAAKYSRLMGLREIQQELNAAGFYDASRGGGIWVGKHYGPNSERIGDPVADHSHAATVRQLLRFFLLLHQRALVSPEASTRMLEIFESPGIPHDDVKFVKGLAGRDARILRKLGSWQDWQHDSAIVTATDRSYILVAMTKHARGDDYLVALAPAVDDLMVERSAAPR